MATHIQQAYAEKRRDIEQYFVESNRVPDSSEAVISPSGQYQLRIEYYENGPQNWAYSRGIVTRLSDGALVADVKRNYPHFPCAWVPHRNGSEYLLCGEDYQGYSVINLTAGFTKIYISASLINGGDFCWAQISPSPDGLIIAVEGCIWAAPYEVWFYDFADPTLMPLPIIDRVQDDAPESIGWESDRFAMKIRHEVRKVDGARYRDLAAEEQAVLDADPSRVEERTEILYWRRPA